MIDFDKKIEEYTKMLKLIEQEYIMTMGKIKELEQLKKEEEEDKQMASFTGSALKDVYKDILHTSNSNTGLSTTIKQITHGQL